MESPGYFVSGVNPRQGGNVVHVARPPAAHESSTTAVAESEKGKKKKREYMGIIRVREREHGQRERGSTGGPDRQGGGDRSHISGKRPGKN